LLIDPQLQAGQSSVGYGAYKKEMLVTSIVFGTLKNYQK